MIGAIVSILSQAMVIFGVQVAPDTISKDVDAVFQVIAIGAGLYSAYKRKTSTLQPLTLTQTGADLHPQTLANAQAPLPVTGIKP
jgi:hypothetical protein